MGRILPVTDRQGSAKNGRSYTKFFIWFARHEMSLWVRLLVFVSVGTFVGIALVLVIRGDNKAAAGAFVIAALMFPLLIEVIWPGKYVLRKPDGEVPDDLVNRLRQFRLDHPGLDGTLFLAILALLGIALLAGTLARFAKAFNMGSFPF